MGEGRSETGDVSGEYRVRVGPLTVLRLVLGLIYVVLGALAAVDHRLSTAALWGAAAIVWLGSAAVAQRGHTLVDAEGVVVKTVNHFRRMSWDEVNFTTSAPSTHWPPADLTLRAENGRELPTHIPALRWAEVKAYGEQHRSVQDHPSSPA